MRTFDDLLYWLSRIAGRAPILLAFVAIGGLLGGGIALTLPPVFGARAKLVVESEKIPDRLAVSTVQTKAVEHLQIIEQRLLSRGALMALADRLDVYGVERPPPDAIVADMRGRITFDIQSGDVTRRNPETATLLTVGFESGSPVLAAAVANELVTRVMAEDVEMRTTVARQTLEFFDSEVTRLAQQLSDSGAELMAFRAENRAALPETRETRDRRLTGLETELAALERDMADLREERDRLTRLHRANRRLARGEAPTSYEARQVAALTTTLRNLPEGDPGVPELERRIASLQARLDQRDAADAPERRTAYHDRMDAIDARLRDGDARRIALLDQRERLEGVIGDAPVKVAELATLERDHEVLRAQYEQAREAKALAETGDAIETLSKGQRIAVVEQAAVPRLPLRPNRGLVLAGGLGLGTLAALMIIAALEYRLGGLRRPVDLTRRMGIAPLVTLPVIDVPQDAPRRRTGWRWMLALVLLGLAAGLMSVSRFAEITPTEVVSRLVTAIHGR